MKNSKAKLGTRLYEAIDWIGHKLPPALLRMISLPVDYQTKTIDGFAFESARMINTAFGIVKNNKIIGDYAEFGVYKGKTFIEAYKARSRHSLDEMKCWAFDSFQGLPEVDGKDKDGAFYTGEFAYSLDEFRQNLVRYNVDLTQVEFVEGYYDDTLSQEKRKTGLPDLISIAWIDCDLYESTIPVLEFLSDVLVDGAVLIFDDWYCFNSRPDKGEQLACREWLDKNPGYHLTEYQNFHWAGKSFIFNRNVNE